MKDEDFTDWLIDREDCIKDIVGKTADDMFKELGYTKIYCEDGFFYYKAKNNKTILFNLKNKEWSVYDYDTAEQRGYGNKELEAILLQEYELGWLNWKNYKLELNNI